MTCTGSCRVSNKANDSAWVVEESYFNSALSLADKGESGTHPSPPPTEMGLSVPLLSYLPLASPHWPTLSPGFSWWQEQGTACWGLGAEGGQFLPGLDGCSGSLSAAGHASALGPVMAPCPLSPPLSCPQGACLLESTASPSSSCFLVRARPGLAVAVGEGGWEVGDSGTSVPALSPATAPTSFEGPFGKIVHQVRATIDTPRFSKDHQCSCVFYILSPLNLNSIPDIEVSLGQWPAGWLPPLSDALSPAQVRPPVEAAASVLN